MNYLEERKIGGNELKSGWIVVVIAKLGFLTFAF